MFAWSGWRGAVAAVVLVLSGLSESGAADEVLVRAQRSLDTGDAPAAYSILNPLQKERAGDPEYDFLLGRAALATGRNTEAVFALERVLALKPNNGPARALIAQAYFNLKEIETARREFETVRKQDVPQDVSASIARFLEAIDRVDAEDKAAFHGYVQFGIGHDSNVNSGTSETTVAVPTQTSAVTLSDSSTRQSDRFMSLGAGLNFRNPLKDRLSLVGGLNMAVRSNTEQSTFDTLNLDYNLGLSYKTGRETITGTLNYENFFVQSPDFPDTYRVLKGGLVEWQHDYDRRNQASAFLQLARLEYPNQPFRDTDRAVLGGGYAHALKSGAVLFGGIYAGREAQQDADRPDMGFRLEGIRAGGEYEFRAKWTAFGLLSYERRHYSGDDASFLVRREDRQSSLATGLTYLLARATPVTLQVLYIRNDSNLVIDEFNRLVYTLSIRRQF